MYKLREIAKLCGLKGYLKPKKAELVEKLSLISSKGPLIMLSDTSTQDMGSSMGDSDENVFHDYLSYYLCDRAEYNAIDAAPGLLNDSPNGVSSSTSAVVRSDTS